LQAEGILHPCDALERKPQQLTCTDDHPKEERENQAVFQQMEVADALKGCHLHILQGTGELIR